MPQRGGIIIDTRFSPKEAMDQFMDGLVKCTLLSKSSAGGILFVIEFGTPSLSPYKCTRSNAVEVPIIKLLLKIAYISKNSSSYRHAGQDISLMGCSPKEFKAEVITQCEIFNSSLDEYLEPICPSVVYSDIISGTMLNWTGPQKAFLRKLHDIAEGDTRQLLKDLIDTYSWNFQLGFIVMELLEGFKPLYSAVTDASISHANKEKYRHLTIFELWRLYNLGYIHGDPHEQNFMVNTEYEYLDGANNTGRVIIIDFGRTFKLANAPSITKTNMSQVVVANLNNPPPVLGNSFNMLSHFSYQWLGNFPTSPITSGNFNNELLKIYNSRESAKREFMKHARQSIFRFHGTTYRRGGSEPGHHINYKKIDPDNVLTLAYIKKYIQREHAYADAMKKQILNTKTTSKSSTSSRRSKSSKSIRQSKSTRSLSKSYTSKNRRLINF